MHTIYDLPEPGTDDLSRSHALCDIIRQEIDNHGGLISFADFMQLALYHPTLGYYCADSFDLGEHGDFTTAPEISPLFAACFARQIQPLFIALNHHQVLEIGAGTGRFACDLIHALNKLDCPPTHYFIYEASERLRQKQQAFLKQTCPTFFSRVTWLETLPTEFNGVMVANEVIDALPVHGFRIEENGITERCVTRQHNTFTWQYTPPTSTLLTDAIIELRDRYSLASGYESEINLRAHSFIQSLANALTTGVILIADYGYGQQEYYHPERRHGTLTCFYKHRRHDDPLILPGLQDITAHVDFTRVVEHAVDAGCSLAGYTSQAAFLLACGLLTIAAEEEKNLSPVEEFKLHHAIKLLTLPTEMGERVKIMALSKNCDVALVGFSMQDRRREL